jgi:hypothetical protein
LSAAILTLVAAVAAKADPNVTDAARVGMAALGVVGRDALERGAAFAFRLFGREDPMAQAFAEIVERDVEEPKVQGNVKHTIRAALDAIDDAALEPLKRLCQQNVVNGRFFDRFSRQVARMLCESTNKELEAIPRVLRILLDRDRPETPALFVIARFDVEGGEVLEQYGLVVKGPQQAAGARARSESADYEMRADDLRRLAAVFGLS